MAGADRSPAAAGGAGRRLSLAAAPTFAILAAWTGIAGSPDAICSSSPGMLPLAGMTLMYLLMSLFHLPPWLTLLAGRRQRRV